MTKKEFFREVVREKRDLLGDFISLLKKRKIPFCVIGGLAVNAYTEPVVSLDLDVVAVAGGSQELMSLLEKKYKVERYPNSINISSLDSGLRIQLQTDPRYQDFIKRAKEKEVLGYRLPVANIKDLLQGKIWAAQDQARRPSKRQKDLADILRLIESRPRLSTMIPFSLKKKLTI